MTPSDMLAVVASLAFIVVTAVKARDKRQESITNTAMKLLIPLQERIAVVEALNARLEGRISNLEHENGRLWLWGRLNYSKVLELGGEPAALEMAP